MAQNSPGIQTVEIDLSSYVPSVNSTVGAFCGVFRWGPLNEIITLSNEGDLLQRFAGPDQDTATSFFTAARFLSYSDALRIVRAAATNSEDYLFEEVTTVDADMTGTGFLTSNPRIRPGSIVKFGAEERTVVSVESDTEATLDSAFTTDLTDEDVTVSIYIGALNATAEEGTGSNSPGIGVLIKNQADYDNNFSDGLADVGPFAARCPGDLGNSIRVSVCPSANAFLQTLAGTVSSSGTTLTGVGTAFLSRLIPGSIIRDLATGQERKVASVASDTSATLQSAFSPNLGLGSTVSAKWEYADAVGVAPGTSEFVLNKNGANDELHIVVIDIGGEFPNSQPGNVLETFSYVSKARDAKLEDGTSNYYVERINRTSRYIYWTDHLPAGTNWGSNSSGTTFTAVNSPATMRLTGGRDGNTGSAIDAARNLGYDLFADQEGVDISILMAGEAPSAVALHVLALAESRQDCVALVSPERADVVDNPGNEVADVIEFRNTLPATSYGIMGSNWLNIYDKYRDAFVWIPDNGDLAGIIARSDAQTEAWYSPAGYKRGVLNEVVKLAWNPRKAARDDLYLAYINFVVSQTGSGPVWIGDKTMLGRPSAFDRINVRRLFIVLRKSISIIAKSILHEHNDEITRNNFINQTEPYLRTVQSRRGIEQFRVVCDETNNTAEVRTRNEFVGDIYVIPNKVINFIRLNFIATRAGVAFNEIVGKF